MCLTLDQTKIPQKWTFQKILLQPRKSHSAWSNWVLADANAMLS